MIHMCKTGSFNSILFTCLSILLCWQSHAQEKPVNSEWRIGAYRKNATDEIEQNGIYRISHSPDGKLLALRDQNNTTTIFNTQTKERLCEIGGHEYHVTTLQFSPDSKILLTASPGNDERIKLWNPITGEMIREIPLAATHAVFSYGGNRIFAIDRVHVHEFETTSGRLVKKTQFKRGTDRAKAVSRDGRYVVVYQRMNDRQTYIAKRIDLKSDSSAILPGPAKPMNAVAISEDMRWIAATFHDDPKIRLWDLKEPGKTNFSLEAHKNRAQAIAFSPDNRFLISTSWDQTAIVWDLISKQNLGNLAGHSAHVTSASFAPRGMKAATGASGKNDCSVINWELEQVYFPDTPKQVLNGDFDVAWREMGSTFGRVALDAVNNLRHSTNEKLFDYIRGKFQQDSHSVDQEALDELIAKLDSPKFAERQAATEQLLNSVAKAESVLRAKLETDCSSEVRYRILGILSHEVTRPPIEITKLRRLHRCVFLLELLAEQQASRQQAIEILQFIVDCHRHPDIASDAAAALKRMN